MLIFCYLHILFASPGSVSYPIIIVIIYWIYLFSRPKNLLKSYHKMWRRKQVKRKQKRWKRFWRQLEEQWRLKLDMLYGWILNNLLNFDPWVSFLYNNFTAVITLHFWKRVQVRQICTETQGGVWTSVDLYDSAWSVELPLQFREINTGSHNMFITL